MPLAVVTRSGTTPSWSQANQSPVRQKPDWISSAMNTTPLSLAHAASAGRKPGRRHDEAALALDRLDHDAGEVGRADLLVERSIARAAASSPDSPSRNGYDIGAR